MFKKWLEKFGSAHLGVLFGSVAVGLALWFTWLWWVGGWAHGEMVRKIAADTPPAATAPAPPLPTASAAASGAAPAPAMATASAPEPAASAPDREKKFAELGQTGDFFGGLNTLLTALAGAIVFWAGYLQKEQLNQARRDAIVAQEEAAAERATRKRQEFESLFFQVLALTRELMERVETPPLVPKRSGQFASEPKKLPARKGAAALDNFASRIGLHRNQVDGDMARFKELVWRYGTSVYNVAPSALGPYFRMLYQLFKLVDESGLDEEHQIRYANIARAQISEGAVLLLALNGWGPYGYKFVPLIEKFGLLEHMHPKYRDAHRERLEWAYRPRAFLGKTARALPGNEWSPTPLHPQFMQPQNPWGGAPPESDNEVPEGDVG